MISTDQPTILGDTLVAAFSSRDDGSMLNRDKGRHADEIVDNRRRFCEANRINYHDVVYQRIVYSDGASYDLTAEVDERSTVKYATEIVADGLFTRHKNIGLFLPVADCVATILYDEKQGLLALLHLGRHSTLADLLPRMVNKFIAAGSQLGDIKVWMSPSAGRSSYRMEYFDHQNDPTWQGFFDVKPDGIYLDMAGYNHQRCLQAGLAEGNIEVSSVDTMRDSNYFSHAKDGTADRVAALVYMR